MNIPRIQIKTTPMRLDYKTTPGSLEIDQGSPNSLDIRTEQGKLEIKTEKPKLTIDQSQCFAEVGLKKPEALIADSASFGKQKAVGAIGRIVEQGNQLSDTSSGVDMIAEQAIQNADQFVYDWNIDFLPKSRPQIDVKEGSIDINYTPAKVINNTLPKPVKMNYKQSKVDLYVKQYNKIEFSTINMQV